MCRLYCFIKKQSSVLQLACTLYRHECLHLRLPHNGMSEIKRLKTLLPSELRSQVIVVRSNKVNPALISTRKTSNNRFAVQIDLMRWQQINLNQRDLLFWHEIARIKNRTVSQLPNDLLALGLGLCALLVELVRPNLILLPVTLVVVGLVVNQISQRRLGEQGLREATAADQKAISLAMQFGYCFSMAYSSLYDALKTRSRQDQIRWRYQVRLQALEICVRRNESSQRLFEPEVAITKRIQNLIFDPVAFSVEQLN